MAFLRLRPPLRLSSSLLVDRARQMLKEERKSKRQPKIRCRRSINRKFEDKQKWGNLTSPFSASSSLCSALACAILRSLAAAWFFTRAFSFLFLFRFSCAFAVAAAFLSASASISPGVGILGAFFCFFDFGAGGGAGGTKDKDSWRFGKGLRLG